MDEQNIILSIDEGQVIRTISIERKRLYLIIEQGLRRLDTRVKNATEERAMRAARNLIAFLKPISSADFTIDDADEGF